LRRTPWRNRRAGARRSLLRRRRRGRKHCRTHSPSRPVCDAGARTSSIEGAQGRCSAALPRPTDQQISDAKDSQGKGEAATGTAKESKPSGRGRRGEKGGKKEAASENDDDSSAAKKRKPSTRDERRRLSDERPRSGRASFARSLRSAICRSGRPASEIAEPIGLNQRRVQRRLPNWRGSLHPSRRLCAETRPRRHACAARRKLKQRIARGNTRIDGRLDLHGFTQAEPICLAAFPARPEPGAPGSSLSSPARRAAGTRLRSAACSNAWCRSGWDAGVSHPRDRL